MLVFNLFDVSIILFSLIQTDYLSGGSINLSLSNYSVHPRSHIIYQIPPSIFSFLSDMGHPCPLVIIQVLVGILSG